MNFIYYDTEIYKFEIDTTTAIKKNNCYIVDLANSIKKKNRYL
jgi:hypothetical protein